ncbi:lysostaphin resistance A-like protein [Spiroplasma sp. Moj]|uniref:CPBP family intramembrane glutamic endopeptidase n=1 Tax=Spiroplasma sp. Moj TaxID=1922342 RepID=UPI0039F0BD09|nr:CPBP family intramembrane metalloprotease [Spiroplasma sp. Moj]
MTNNDNVYNPKRAWYELKPTLVDCAAPFAFNLVKLKNTGYIFLGTAIFAPFFINILISYIFTHNEYALAGMNFISWIIVTVGSYFVISGAQNEIMRSGAIAFYYFYFIPNIIGLVIGTIVNQFHPSDSVKTTINLLTLIIAGLVTIFILYRSSPLIFEKIKLTLKQDCKRLFVVCSISIIAVFSIHLFFVYLQSLITATTSNNQNNLIKGLDKWWNIAFLFIYTILIAPVVEELATRHGIFSLSGNKWLGFVASTIFFAGMHVAGTGEWEHFIGYIGASLTLGMLFLIVNGNVTYTIIPHAGYNCIVAILMLAAPKFLA